VKVKGIAAAAAAEARKALLPLARASALEGDVVAGSRAGEVRRGLNIFSS